MNQEITLLISDFNNTLLSLASNVAMVCPNSIISANYKEIEKQINRRDNFNKFIDLFCIKVLQYKDQIDLGDESFFMNKDYKNDLIFHFLSLSILLKMLYKFYQSHHNFVLQVGE